MSFWKPRQSTMISVSSAVVITAFEPALAAWNACRSKRASASSCVQCNSATSSHLSLVHFGHVQDLTMQRFSVLWAFPLFHRKFHETGLVGGTTMEFRPLSDMVSPCQVLVLECCVCTPVHSFSFIDWSLAVYIKNNINPLSLCCFLENPSQGCITCAKVLLSPFHPINDAGRRGWNVFGRSHIPFKLSCECSLVWFL